MVSFVVVCRSEFVVASKIVNSRHRIAAGISKLPQACATFTFTPSTWRGSRGAVRHRNESRQGPASHHRILFTPSVTRKNNFCQFILLIG